MKLKRILFMPVIAILSLSPGVYSRGGNPGKTSSSQSDKSVDFFLGRWDLTLKAPDREYGSWLEIRQEKGQLKAQMVGRWGNARPLPKVEIRNGSLEFVSPKEEEDRSDDMVFKGKLAGTTLSGSTTGPDGKIWQWTGRRAPSLKRTAAPQWFEPARLFNGKDLTGWRFDNPQRASSWKVEN